MHLKIKSNQINRPTIDQSINVLLAIDKAHTSYYSGLVTADQGRV